jgi:hypothetical protein
MNEYTVVGPTNFQPRFFKSFDNAVADSEIEATPDACDDSPSRPNGTSGA